MNQVERKIKEMREELTRLIDSSYSPNFTIDRSNPAEEIAWRRGRASGLFEALVVIEVLQAGIKRLQTQQFRDNRCLSLPEVGKKYRKKFDDSEGSWKNIWECVEFASTTLNEGKRVYLHQINGYGKTAPFLEDFIHQFEELIENDSLKSL